MEVKIRVWLMVGDRFELLGYERLQHGAWKHLLVGGDGWNDGTFVEQHGHECARDMWIGVHDRKGREIYEHDLVRRLHFKPNGEPNGSAGLQEVLRCKTSKRNGWNIASGIRLVVAGNTRQMAI